MPCSQISSYSVPFYLPTFSSFGGKVAGQTGKTLNFKMWPQGQKNSNRGGERESKMGKGEGGELKRGKRKQGEREEGEEGERSQGRKGEGGEGGEERERRRERRGGEKGRRKGREGMCVCLYS